MNINKLLDELKKKIGLTGHLTNTISDLGLRDIIYMSLEEFNRVSSAQIRIPIRYFANDIMNFNLPVYDPRFNSNYVEIEIAKDIVKMCDDYGIEIKQVHMHRTSSAPFIPNSMNMKADMLALNNSHLRAINTRKPILRVRPPNTLIIENYVADLVFYQAYEMVMQVTHPKTLSTISKGLERWFEELCRKNIELVLYNNDLRFLNIDIGSVRVELNIDNFQNAESEKKELMQEMRLRAAADDMFISM
ncbi:MAG: hypothetical protein ACRCX2_36340 [Paraclostridium sp.]